MNFSSKHSNLVIFLLFVVIIAMLFTTVVNSSTDTNKIKAALLIIFLLVLGGAWFLLNSKIISESTRATSLNLKQQEAHRVAETSKTEAETSDTENKEAFDTTNFLPRKYKTLEEFSELVLQKMANDFNLVQGLVYVKSKDGDIYEPIAQYAYFSENKPSNFKVGETLPGQAVKNRNIVTLADIPDNYMTIASGLGKSATKYLVMIPLISRDEVVGLIEYATFSPVKDETSKILVNIAELVADAIVKLIKK